MGKLFSFCTLKAYPLKSLPSSPSLNCSFIKPGMIVSLAKLVMYTADVDSDLITQFDMLYEGL